jgi:hypothetical protein
VNAICGVPRTTHSSAEPLSAAWNVDIGRVGCAESAVGAWLEPEEAKRGTRIFTIILAP